MPIKVYLDSNVIMRLVFERDKNVVEIAEASRKGKLEIYVSWLSLTEISKSVSRMAKHREAQKRIEHILTKNNIRFITKFDPTLSSGTITPLLGGFDYSDYLHLLIASRLDVNYFITYDLDLLSTKQFEAFDIVEPSKFVEHVLGARK